MTNPHKDTTTPANAHHEADKGQIEPLIDNADTTPPDNPVTGKVIAERMAIDLTSLGEDIADILTQARDIANAHPTMTTADFDMAMNGLIGFLWDAQQQVNALLPVPAQIYSHTLDVDFVNITDKAIQRFLDEHQATENATGDSEPCNQ